MASPPAGPGALLDDLGRQLDACMLQERTAFAKRLQGLRKRVARGLPADRGSVSLAQDLQRSVAEVAARVATVPEQILAPDLPITAHAEELGRVLSGNPVTIVCGDTGSGKSTQLPRLCLALGRGARGMIGHTQPRRIAARAVASRVAEEVGPGGSDLVGYKVRFADSTGPQCRVKLMTDGILLAELAHDRDLLAYDTLIIDEAHERSLNIDFLLGYLHRLRSRRPDLAVIIASATLDAERFSAHFDNAPVVQVAGRGFPIELRYEPLPNASTDTQSDALAAALTTALATIDRHPRAAKGDVLTFLATEREIREVAASLRHHQSQREILPLYGRLSAAAQDKVFKPGSRRRLVLATNVAETSLTVPRITAVIDAGRARISRYSVRSKLQRLPVEAVSRASADQRMGRCGRIAPGLCIRLYSEDDYCQRPAFTEPEIMRTNLASVILRMATLGLGAIEDFPFVDAPDSRLVNDGYRLLQTLQAVDDAQSITALGREIAAFPVDPRLGRILVAGRVLGCAEDARILVAALSIQDPRERPPEARSQADEKQAAWSDPRSDLNAYLLLWRAWQAQKAAGGSASQRRWCRDHFLSFMRMREWGELERQLRRNSTANQPAASSALLHRAALTGLIDRIALRDGKQEYRGARGLSLRIFPGSAVAARQPRWLVAATFLETARTYAIDVAAVKRGWIEEAGAHLLRRDYFEPHYSTVRGRVEAFERVTLFGLLLHTKRRVNYGPIDAAAARDVFIREALVGHQLRTRGGFQQGNQRLLAELESLEARVRRRDIVAGAQARVEFFEHRLPAGISSARAFERWRIKAEKSEPQLLCLQVDDLVTSATAVAAARAVPTHLHCSGNELPLHYRFAPGEADDGVTLRVPRALLAGLDAARLERLVPGGLQEKVLALLRTLPKPLRRQLIPAQEFASAATQAVAGDARRLTGALSDFARRQYRCSVPPEAWQEGNIEPWLRLRIEVVDGQGEVVEEGRDFDALRGRAAPPGTTVAASGWEVEDVREWDFDTLPVSVQVERNGLRMIAWPALRERAGKVQLCLLDDEGLAASESRRGIARLALLRFPQQAQLVRRALSRQKELPLLAATHGKPEQLLEDFTLAVAIALLPKSLPKDKAAFDAWCEKLRSQLAAAADVRADVVMTSLRGAQSLRRLTGKGAQVAPRAVAEDIEAQLSQLLYPGFLLQTPDEWLGELPRYIEAAALRLEKAGGGGGARDAQLAAQFAPRWQRWLDLPARLRDGAPHDAPLVQYRWLVEEYRVSLYAQTLRTRVKISAKRLDNHWEKLLDDLRERGALNVRQ